MRLTLATCCLGGWIGNATLAAATNDPASPPNDIADLLAQVEPTLAPDTAAATDRSLERLLAGQDEEIPHHPAEAEPWLDAPNGPSDPGLEALLSELTNAGAESQGPFDAAHPLFQELPSAPPNAPAELQAQWALQDAKMQELEDENRRLRDQAQQLQSALDRLQAELADKPQPSAALAEARAAEEEREQTRQRLESKLDKLAEKNQRLRTDNESLSEELALVKSQAAELDEKLKVLETGRAAAADELRRQLAAREAELAALQTDRPAAAAERDPLQRELAADSRELQEQRQRADESLASLRAELAEKEKRLLAVDEDNQRLRKEQAESAAYLRDLRAETAEKDGQIQNEARDRAREVGQLQERLAQSQNELAVLQAARTEQATAAAASAKLKREWEAATRLLRNQETRAAAAVAELRAELAAKDGQIQALQTAVENAKDRAEQAENLQHQLEARARKKLEAALQANANLERRLAQLGEASGSRPGADDPAQAAKEPETADGVPAPRIAPPVGTLVAQIRQLLQAGDNAAALAAVQEARQALPTDVNLALLEGLALIRLQRYAEAARNLAPLAKAHPRNADIHAALGAAMLGSGFYDEAREILLLANRLDKRMPECLFNLAQLHAFVDPIDLPTARKFYLQARALGLAANSELEKALQ